MSVSSESQERFQQCTSCGSVCPTDVNYCVCGATVGSVNMAPEEQGNAAPEHMPQLKPYVLCTRFIAIFLLLVGLAGFVTEVKGIYIFSVWDGLISLAGYGICAYFVWTTGSMMRTMGIKSRLKMAAEAPQPGA